MSKSKVVTRERIECLKALYLADPSIPYDETVRRRLRVPKVYPNELIPELIETIERMAEGLLRNSSGRQDGGGRHCDCVCTPGTLCSACYASEILKEFNLKSSQSEKGRGE